MPWNRILSFSLLITLLLAGCQTPEAISPPGGADAAAGEQATLAPRLIFLTRGACVNTPVVLANLEQALVDRGYAADFVIVDTSTLSATDPRCGYGTPTILLDGRDLFGLPEPAGGAPYVPM